MVSREDQTPPLALALFGPFDVRLQGRPLPRPHSQKTHWLLALLALQEGRAVERAWLAGTLWPDSAEHQAAFNLRRALWHLRQSLGDEGCRLEAPNTGTLRLNMSGAEADLLVFDEAIARGDASSLEQAVALHRGPLLQGCDEDWVLLEREAREQAYLGALERLADHAIARGEHAEAVRYLRQLVAADPLRDSAHRALMQALVSLGDIAAAGQVYRDFRLYLHRELNTAPDGETTALYQRIRARVGEGGREGGSEGKRERESERARERESGVDGSPIEAAAAPSLARSLPLHLPRPVSRFIGREREIAELAGVLAEARLVTLTGPGGVGKTRLSLQVAEAAARHYPDGVWFVDLASVTDPALVANAVARVLSVGESAEQAPEERLQVALARQRRLLVLDNCEHLLDACATLVAALLPGCPELTVLTTSRQSLGVPGETIWRVEPLSLPGSGVQALRRSGVQAGADSVVRDAGLPPNLNAGTPERLNALSAEPLLQSDAMRLFVDRATAAVRTFQLTESNVRAVAEICHRLEGIPLAIELAAARLPALPVAQLAERLEDRLGLLTRGNRAAPTRQQTLQAALDWSYELLTAPEQALLRRLAVFVGGCTLEAAEAVCGELGCWVLDLLAQLVDQSLVYVEERAGEVRYRLLETTREYAGRRLAETGEEQAARERHRDWCLALAARVEPTLSGPEQIAGFDLLEAEYDNLRAALDWSRASAASVLGQHRGGHAAMEPLEAALRLAFVLGRFWRARGDYVRERRERLAELMDEVRRFLAVIDVRSEGDGSARDDLLPSATCPVSPAFLSAWAQVVYTAGVIGAADDRYEIALRHLDVALSLSRRLADRPGEARALLALGLTQSHLGAYGRARELYEESLRIARECQDLRGVAVALNNLGTAASFLGDLAAARRHYEEALALHRSQGNLSGMSLAMSNLAGSLGEDEAGLAERYHEECLAIETRQKSAGGILSQLASLTALAFVRRDRATAQRRIQECRDRENERGDPDGLAVALYHVGEVCLERGQAADARPLLEESLEIVRARGNRGIEAEALRRLGQVALAAGERRQAQRCFAAALPLYQEVRRARMVLEMMEHLAAIDAQDACPARAARLLGAAEALRETRALPLPAWQRAGQKQAASAARVALGETAFATAWTEGRALSFDQAVAVALEDFGR